MGALSGTMQLALDSIEQAPGTLVRRLPGGSGTVRALMRRGKVEVQGPKILGDCRAFLPAHQHTFKTTFHLDGCHHYQTGAACECGVVYGHYGERSPKADPYSAIWMDDPDGCVRCRRLMEGARPVNETMIERPPNYVEPV